ncbi:sugar-binding domain-containing protein [Glaciihabitans sp. UYNi722]|uniref:sugar-binding transcriptional regulator n=1 Tax=Glaciihabitans sp. UYNi722 TaxID=3156344 RepID=UPI0033931961
MSKDAQASGDSRPRPELDRAMQIRLADVARAYYLHRRSKVEIAADFVLSRFQVAKMLDDALESGVVSITIRDPRNRIFGLDEQLSDLLGIARVRVVELVEEDRPENAEQLGRAVMDILKEMARPRMTIGISWSRALDLAVRFLPDLPPCDIVQLAGALQVNGAGFLPRVIAQLGESPGIHTYPISAPLVVDEKSTALDLMRQSEIAEALARADHLDLAVVAIGAWKPGESSVWEKVSPADRDAGSAAGAVAEISGRLLGVDGQAVHTGLDERTIGVRIEQLVGASEVIAVARGVGRLEAVLAAAKAGIVTCLVLDSALAAAILATDSAHTTAEEKK